MDRACTGMILSSDENQKQKPLDRGLHHAAMTALPLIALTFVLISIIILKIIIIERIIMKFYDRETELALLQDLTDRSAQYSQFTAIFGRRRIGKTELVRQHLENRGIYFFVEKRPSNALLAEFSATLKSHIPHAPAFTDWKDFLVFLFAETQHRHLIVVFDEFQNFLSVEPALYSILQGVWDTGHKQSRIHLIAIGSVVGLMKKVFQDAKEPLYGRLTREIDLSPLPIGAIYQIATDLGFQSPTDILTLYGIFGGMPRYYEIIESMDLGGSTIPHILHRALFTPFAPFRNEMRDIILSEFGGTAHTYLAILEAIATGKTRRSEIAGPAGMPATSLSKYLRELSDLFDLIEREVPITEQSWKTKKSRYKIRDPFITFWMRFIYRQLSIYESGNFPYFLNRLDTYISEFMGLAFENITRELLIQRNHHNTTPFYFHRIGRWWDRQSEIDLVALNPETRQTLFVECKWTSTPVGTDVLQTLKHRAQKLPTSDAFYLIASKSGFTDTLKNLRDPHLYLWDPNDIATFLDKKNRGIRP